MDGRFKIFCGVCRCQDGDQLTPQRPSDPFGGIALEFGRDVAVGAEGERYLRVAEDLHGHPRRHTLAEQERGRRVPGVVQPRVPHAGVGEQVLPGGVVGAGVDGAPMGLGEDQPVILPLAAGAQPLGGLLGAVRAQRLDQLRWEADRPSSGAARRPASGSPTIRASPLTPVEAAEELDLR